MNGKEDDLAIVNSSSDCVTALNITRVERSAKVMKQYFEMVPATLCLNQSVRAVQLGAIF